jgi:DNA (cytosine-5)-methyltransferase 1
VRPLWDRYAYELDLLGWSAWSGVLEAADYGVPQTRRRAILIATPPETMRTVGRPPATHAKGGADGLLPWVSMGEALGWGLTERPAPTVVGTSASGGGPRPLDGGQGARDIMKDARFGWSVNTGRDWKPGGTREDAQRIGFDQPAPTFTGMPGGQWRLETPFGDYPKGSARSMDEPAPTMAFGKSVGDIFEWHEVTDDVEQPERESDGEWWRDRPATTVAGDPRIFAPGGHIAHDGRDNSRMVGRSENAIRVELWHALVLQSFPPWWPVQGTRTSQFGQVGDAVPPGLARAVLAEAAGIDP